MTQEVAPTWLAGLDWTAALTGIANVPQKEEGIPVEYEETTITRKQSIFGHSSVNR